MRFTSKEDIEAPIEHVFAQVSDFQSFERAALRRGAEIRCNREPARPGVGLRWHARFLLRGKQREVDTEVTTFDPPNCLAVAAHSTAFAGQLGVDLVALSPGRTRMTVDLVVKPQTLPARLLVQSLKLARTNLTRRFKKRVADYAAEVEDRYKRRA